ANRAHALGVAAWKSGNIQQARMLLANAAMAEPDNLAIPRDLAKLLWTEGDGEQALKLLDSLPPEAQSEPDIARLHAHLNLAETARQAPPLTELDARLARAPDDLDAHYQRAAQLLAADDFAGAMQALLFIACTDRGYRHDIGRTSLLALFDLLGSAHPLTQQYRRALSESPLRHAGCRCVFLPPTAASPRAITKPRSCTAGACRPAPIPGTTY
ncbi:MAG: putative thioredoxin protein, partial [Proteobacteria bacterium]|nr:putative thioredoxin protein [Pseudomonadota bacterium]